MKKQTNLTRIAEAAGVSVSTVDRVMNGRGAVSLARRRKVIEAARLLGAHRVPAVPSHFSLHVNVIRTAADDEYFARLENALSTAASVMSPNVVLHFSRETPKSSGDWSALVHASSRRRHGIIMLAHDRSDEPQAPKRAGKSTTPIVALSSDIESLAQRFYIGIDNRGAGRTAAFMIAGFAPPEGRVLLLTGPQSFRVHRERAEAFLEAIGRLAPGLEVIGPVDTGDRLVEARRATRDALRGDAPLVAIYNTGGANSGIAGGLGGSRANDRPVWVAHEATLGNLALLREGWIRVILDQDPDAQAMAALQYVLYANGEIGTAPHPEIRFHVVTSENVPRETTKLT